MRFFLNPESTAYLRELSAEFGVSSNGIREELRHLEQAHLGHLEAAYLIDDYALGRDTGIIDILLVGEIDPYHLTDLTRKTERYIERKIRMLVFSQEEFERLGLEMLKRPHVRLWG
jgi:hypothetical protein